MGGSGLMAPHDAYPQAKEAAEKAIEIDNSNGEFVYALAETMTWYDWDWIAAERENKRSIELSPKRLTLGKM